MLPARVARAASQVRCQRGSLVGKVGVFGVNGGRGLVWVVEWAVNWALAGRGRRVAPAVSVASLRKSRRREGRRVEWRCGSICDKCRRWARRR